MFTVPDFVSPDYLSMLRIGLIKNFNDFDDPDEYSSNVSGRSID